MPNILRGTVTKAGAMAKTITVTITRRFEHPKYLKQMERSTKLLVHDELQEAKVGDRVSITHTRPLSSSKNFYLSAIDVRPGEGSIPLEAGAPALPPARTMEQVRRRAEAAGTKKRAEEAGKSAMSAKLGVEGETIGKKVEDVNPKAGGVLEQLRSVVSGGSEAQVNQR